MSKFKKPMNPEYDQIKDTQAYNSMMDSADSIMSAMMPAVYNNAIELTKLIVENRIRDKEELDDEDIYEIHSESFKRCMPDNIDPRSE